MSKDIDNTNLLEKKNYNLLGGKITVNFISKN
jgi:hypothetical protein